MQPSNVTATLAWNRPINPSGWSAANAVNRFLIAEPSRSVSKGWAAWSNLGWTLSNGRRPLILRAFDEHLLTRSSGGLRALHSYHYDTCVWLSINRIQRIGGLLLLIFFNAVQISDCLKNSSASFNCGIAILVYKRPIKRNATQPNEYRNFKDAVKNFPIIFMTKTVNLHDVHCF